MITGNASTGLNVRWSDTFISIRLVQLVRALTAVRYAAIILNAVIWYAGIFLICSGAWFARSGMARTSSRFSDTSDGTPTEVNGIEIPGELCYNVTR